MSRDLKILEGSFGTMENNGWKTSFPSISFSVSLAGKWIWPSDPFPSLLRLFSEKKARVGAYF